ncbi:hypothetical protein ACRALDRAFT_1079710 [Sodiomyces alcalophilus JCM 7366]|uniref:uncharacterized protein n=1 Tax=Sodiomyces alcalophilus JCM 7366 TaxID=591952 RepID=UPI0039B6C49B
MLSYDSASQPVSPSGLASSINGAPSSKSQSISVQANGSSAQKHHHIWLVTGPAGCGKSTVAEHLAQSLNVPFIEGDSFHPQSNIDKMSNGIPLTDADRWDWLTILREESRKRLASGSDGVVLTCSALKRKYRDVIRVAGYYDHSLLIHFIFLHAPENVLLKRVQARKNHYMGANMVSSQFSILELPQQDEKDVITIDVSRPVEAVKRDALARVSNIMKGEEED